MEKARSLGAFDNLLTAAYVFFIIWFVVSIVILAQLFFRFLTDVAVLSLAGVAAFFLTLTILLLSFVLIEGFRRWLKIHNGPEPRETEEGG